MYLYIHIPFCSLRCDYCDFVSFADISMQDAYVNSLVREIELLSCEYKEELNTLYLGGGTPSILSCENINKIVNAVSENFSFQKYEVTIEANPEDVSYDNAKMWYDAGFNRVSLGIQSFDKDVLKTLGRHIGANSQALAYKNLKKAGFKNISADIIYGVPNQSLKQLRNTLDEVISLNPTHISTYSLIIERGTKIYSKIKKGELTPASDDFIAEQFDFICDYLGRNGYHRYEISNFAKDGFESVHNKAYWRMYETLGAGIGAVYTRDSVRVENTVSMRRYFEYIQNGRLPYDLKQDIGEDDRVFEYIMMNLRLSNGFSASEFQSKFGFSFEEKYSAQIKKLVQIELLKIDISSDNFHIIRLTDNGLNLSNSVICEFI